MNEAVPGKLVFPDRCCSQLMGCLAEAKRLSPPLVCQPVLIQRMPSRTSMWSTQGTFTAGSSVACVSDLEAARLDVHVVSFQRIQLHMGALNTVFRLVHINTTREQRQSRCDAFADGTPFAHAVADNAVVVLQQFVTGWQHRRYRGLTPPDVHEVNSVMQMPSGLIVCSGGESHSAHLGLCRSGVVLQ
eukprot:5926846-Amphidinium_carterae.1